MITVRLDKPVHPDDRAYAAALLDRLGHLTPHGEVCRQLAIDLLVGELRLARTFGEIDGEVLGEQRVIKLRSDREAA